MVRMFFKAASGAAIIILPIENLLYALRAYANSRATRDKIYANGNIQSNDMMH